jgi:DNA-binding response OmpR family regulator
MDSFAAGQNADPKTRASAIQTGKLTVNLDRRVVTVDGNPIDLTGKEYEILEFLSRRKGPTLTKEMFLNHLYGGTDERSSRSSMSSFASSARSSLKRPVAIITSRRCGVAVMSSETRPSDRG